MSERKNDIANNCQLCKGLIQYLNSISSSRSQHTGTQSYLQQQQQHSHVQRHIQQQPYPTHSTGVIYVSLGIMFAIQCGLLVYFNKF